MIIHTKGQGIKNNKDKPATIASENLDCLLEIDKQLQEDIIKGNSDGLVFIGSSCMYPAKQGQHESYVEEQLGTGAPDIGAEAYSYMKLAGWALCKAIRKQYGYNYFTAIESDVYGDPHDTHFIMDLVRKCHYAKIEKSPNIIVWGDGTPIRNPIFNEDRDKAIDFLQAKKFLSDNEVNVSSDERFTIRQTALIIADVVGFTGQLIFDCSQPNGVAKKVLDNSRLKLLGFSTFTSFKDGIEKTYKRFLSET